MTASAGWSRVGALMIALAGCEVVPGATVVMRTDESLERDDPRWWQEPARRARAGSLVAAHVVELPLGSPWIEWRARDSEPRSGCVAFQGATGHDYASEREDYWVYRCSVPHTAGTMEYYAYLLADSVRPTIERVRWVSAPGRPLDVATTRLAQVSLAEALRARRELTPGVPLEPHTWSGSLFRAGLEMFASPRGHLRLGFVPGVVRWEDSILVVDHWSRGLLAEESLEESADAWISPGRRFGRMALPVGTLETLSARWPRLARALERSPRRIDDVDAVRRALESVAGRGVRAGDRDLVRFAASQWIWAFDDTSDTTVVRRIESTLGPLGVEGGWGHYDGTWHYLGSLLRSRATGERSSPWADRAFLYSQETGWAPNMADTAEQFRIVIERGERFLRQHPQSHEWPAVARTVALAHETAWSLARASPDDEYVDWTRYAPEAPEHRRRAIELYEWILRRWRSAPPGRDDLRDVRHRLVRLRLDVDTATRIYYPTSC